MDSDSEQVPSIEESMNVEEDFEEPVEVGDDCDAVVDTEHMADEEIAEVSDEKNLGLKFPLTRVKKIMKADPDLQLASQDAVFLIAKATELFVEVMADAAYHHTMQSKRKTMAGRDVDACIELVDSLAFLDGAI